MIQSKIEYKRDGGHMESLSYRGRFITIMPHEDNSIEFFLIIIDGFLVTTAKNKGTAKRLALGFVDLIE